MQWVYLVWTLSKLQFSESMEETYHMLSIRKD